MIKDEITDERLWEFVEKHLHDDPKQLMLRYSGKELGFPLADAVTQVECRKRCASKLPSFNAEGEFYYPTKLSSEQATNEAVARYHASLVADGSRVADLTAGLGIDAMTISRRAATVDAFEMEEVKCVALRHNASVMGCANLTVHSPGDSIERLRGSDDIYDVIFIDPARRDDAARRTYALSDCTPDVKLELSLLTSRCKRLIIKASPMLDMTQTERDLPGLREMTAVSWRGECKEILCIVEGGYEGAARWNAVMIDAEGVTCYEGADEPASPLILDSIPSPEDGPLYLYEPDSAVMKLGDRAAFTRVYPTLRRVDVNTRLYLSRELYEDFPGRVFCVERLTKLGDKSLKSFRGERRNIVCRNFQLTPAALKGRLKTIDGGSDFIYGMGVCGRQMIAICHPVKEKRQ